MPADAIRSSLLACPGTAASGHRGRKGVNVERPQPAARSARTNDVDSVKARRMLGRVPRDRGQRGVRVP